MKRAELLISHLHSVRRVWHESWIDDQVSMIMYAQTIGQGLQYLSAMITYIRPHETDKASMTQVQQVIDHHIQQLVANIGICSRMAPHKTRIGRAKDMQTLERAIQAALRLDGYLDGYQVQFLINDLIESIESTQALWQENVSVQGAESLNRVHMFAGKRQSMEPQVSSAAVTHHNNASV